MGSRGKIEIFATINGEKMEAKELRIGNLVREFHGKKLHRITAKDILDISQGKFPVEPIPITEEWLLKLGGVKENSFDYKIQFGGIRFHCRYNKKWYSLIENIYLSDTIQYVHQVQNICFELTNKELNISN